MMAYGGKFKAFWEGELREFLETQHSALRDEVEKQSDDYVLNASETEFIDYLVAQYRVTPPQIEFDGVSVDKQEQTIPAEHFPRGRFNVRPGKRYKMPVVIYHLPVTGDVALLRLRPSTHIMRTHEFELDGGGISFGVVAFGGDAEEVKREASERIEFLEKMLGHLHTDLDAYNSQLAGSAAGTFRQRKQEVLKQHELLAALDVPLRERSTVPKTFVVPSPRDRYEIAVKPFVTEKGYEPEPTLDREMYRKVLTIIRDLLRSFEQLPSLYQDRGEEALRDQILLHLGARFEWSAGGETFNRKGKTDILLKHEGANLFAAECKFWGGQKQYLETLDQLLGYLTWRDSKAAVVVFVRNKDFSAVLDTIASATPEHPNCIKLVDRPEEAWFNYRLHIVGDPNREVHLAVLVAHLPPIE